MKISQKDIAKALVEASQEDASHMSAICDNAVLLFRRSNPGKSLRLFPSLVERMLQKKGFDAQATLITPDGNAGEAAESIRKILVDVMKRNVQLNEKADPSLAGGAVLIVGDERFDISLSGALTNLRALLSTSPLASRS